MTKLSLEKNSTIKRKCFNAVTEDDLEKLKWYAQISGVDIKNFKNENNQNLLEYGIACGTSENVLDFLLDKGCEFYIPDIVIDFSGINL
jgi:hypothetical protein